MALRIKAQLQERAAAALSLVLLTTLALFTYYLSQIAERDMTRKPRAKVVTNDPDYFVENLGLLTMNARGEPSLRIEARSMKHLPADDVILFESPVLVSLDPQQPRITIVADHGRAIHGSDETQLSGNVVLTRAGSPGRPPMAATTDFAIVLADQDIVLTDRPVNIIMGGNRLAGTGMELNSRTRQLRLDSSVQAVLQAPAAP
jgi:LPS export ABC transporter protein LptC